MCALSASQSTRGGVGFSKFGLRIEVVFFFLNDRSKAVML